MKTIAVFGGSGLTGVQLSRIGAEAGYKIIAVSRKQLKSLPKTAVNFVGEIDDPEFLSSVVAEADYIVSAIGHNRRTRSPWAPQTSPTTLLADFYRNLLPIALRRPEPPKIIHISAVGIGKDWTRVPAWYRFFVDRSNIQLSYKDHSDALNVLKTYNAERVLTVKPLILTNSHSLTPARAIALPFSLLRSTVSREAVARYIIAHLDDPSTYGHEITLGQ